jgi:glutamate racemase
MTMENRRNGQAKDGPLGVFDSGVGGLSVVRALLAQLPQESLLYVADEAHCPYGYRALSDIRALSEGISRYLIEQGAKVIVVACNTASAAALEYLRATFPATPMVGIVPAVKPAVQSTRSGVVGVLATPATIQGRLYQEVLAQYAGGARIISCACPGLVEHVEAGDLDGPETMALLREYVEPLLEAGADTLVLGCTHYPFLIPALRRLTGDAVNLVEPSDAIARQTRRVLERDGLLADSERLPQRIYATTGHEAQLTNALRRLFGQWHKVRCLYWHGTRLQDAPSDGPYL